MVSWVKALVAIDLATELSVGELFERLMVQLACKTLLAPAGTKVLLGLQANVVE